MVLHWKGTGTNGIKKAKSNAHPQATVDTLPIGKAVIEVLGPKNLDAATIAHRCDPSNGSHVIQDGVRSIAGGAPPALTPQPAGLERPGVAGVQFDAPDVGHAGTA